MKTPINERTKLKKKIRNSIDTTTITMVREVGKVLGMNFGRLRK